MVSLTGGSETIKYLQNFHELTEAIRKSNKEKKFKPYIVDKNIEGTSFEFLIGDLTGEEWYRIIDDKIGRWEEVSFLKKMVSRGEVIYECGGHHGFITVLLSKWLGDDGLMVSFEPNIKNTEIMRKNMKINNIQNVIIEQKAVGSVIGKKHLVLSPNSRITPTRHDLLRECFRNIIYGTEEVDLISIDRYAEEKGIKPTFLKIDVEGYETEVLKGAKETLKSAPKMEIEIHVGELATYHSSVKELLNLVDVSQYECWVQWDGGSIPEHYESLPEIHKNVHLFMMPKEKTGKQS